jgi:hypothetical protein
MNRSDGERNIERGFTRMNCTPARFQCRAASPFYVKAFHWVVAVLSPLSPLSSVVNMLFNGN